MVRYSGVMVLGVILGGGSFFMADVVSAETVREVVARHTKAGEEFIGITRLNFASYRVLKFRTRDGRIRAVFIHPDGRTREIIYRRQLRGVDRQETPPAPQEPAVEEPPADEPPVDEPPADEPPDDAVPDIDR